MSDDDAARRLEGVRRVARASLALQAVLAGEERPRRLLADWRHRAAISALAQMGAIEPGYAPGGAVLLSLADVVKLASERRSLEERANGLRARVGELELERARAEAGAAAAEMAEEASQVQAAVDGLGAREGELNRMAAQLEGLLAQAQASREWTEQAIQLAASEPGADSGAAAGLEAQARELGAAVAELGGMLEAARADAGWAAGAKQVVQSQPGDPSHGLQLQLVQANARAAELEQERAVLEGKLRQSEEEVRAREEMLGSVHTQADQLKQTVSRMDQELAQIGQAKSECEQREDMLGGLYSAIEELESELQQARLERDAALAALAQVEERVQALGRARSAAQAQAEGVQSSATELEERAVRAEAEAGRLLDERRTVEAELNQLRGQRQVQADELGKLKGLQGTVLKLEAQLNQARSTSASAVQGRTQMEARCTEARDECAALVAVMSSLQRKVEAVDPRVASLQAELIRVVETQEGSALALKSFSLVAGELNRAQEQCSQQAVVLQSLEAWAAGLEGTAAEMEAELAQAKQDGEQREAILQELQEWSDGIRGTFEAELAEAQAQIESAQSDAAHAVNGLMLAERSATENEERAQAESYMHTQEAGQLHTKVERLEKMVRELGSHLAEAQAEGMKATQMHQTVAEQLELAQGELARTEAARSALEAGLTGANEQLGLERADAELKAQSYDAQLEESRTRADLQLQAAKDEAELATQGFEAELSQLKAEAQCVGQEQSTIRGELDTKVSELEAALSAATQEGAGAAEQLKASRAELDEVREAYSTSSAELSRLQSWVDGLQGTVGQMDAQLHQTRAEAVAAVQARSLAESELRRTQKDDELLKLDAQRLEKRLSQAKSNALEAMEEQAGLQAWLQRAQDDCKASDDQVKALRAEVDELSSTVKHLEGQLQAARAAAATADHEHSTLETQLNTSRLEQQDRVRALERLREDQAHETDTLDRLQAQSSAAKVHMNALGSELEQAKTAVQRGGQTTLAMEQGLRQAEQRCQVQEQELNSLSGLAEELQGMAGALQARLNSGSPGAKRSMFQSLSQSIFGSRPGPEQSMSETPKVQLALSRALLASVIHKTSVRVERLIVTWRCHTVAETMQYLGAQQRAILAARVQAKRNSEEAAKWRQEYEMTSKLTSSLEDDFRQAHCRAAEAEAKLRNLDEDLRQAQQTGATAQAAKERLQLEVDSLEQELRQSRRTAQEFDSANATMQTKLEQDLVNSQRASEEAAHIHAETEATLRADIEQAESANATLRTKVAELQQERLNDAPMIENARGTNERISRLQADLKIALSAEAKAYDDVAELKAKLSKQGKLSEQHEAATQKTSEQLNMQITRLQEKLRKQTESASALGASSAEYAKGIIRIVDRVCQSAQVQAVDFQPLLKPLPSCSDANTVYQAHSVISNILTQIDHRFKELGSQSREHKNEAINLAASYHTMLAQRESNMSVLDGLKQRVLQSTIETSCPTVHGQPDVEVQDVETLRQTYLAKKEANMGVLDSLKERVLQSTANTASSSLMRDNNSVEVLQKQMKNRVSPETQDSIKAGLVRTQMDGTISVETQDSIRAGLSSASIPTEPASFYSPQSRVERKQANMDALDELRNKMLSHIEDI